MLAPLALLLLDEGAPITGAIWLFKALGVLVLFGLSFFFLLYKHRTSERKPLGVMLAVLLAYIGLRQWPTHFSYESTKVADYVLVFVLCIGVVQ